MMDTVMNYLPTGVSELLLENLIILEVVAMFSIGAYNTLEVRGVFCSIQFLPNSDMSRLHLT